METRIETLKKVRLNFLNVLGELTAEQLNEIPKGFNNNIVWNLGHLLASQQGLCYVRASLKMTIDEQLFLSYKPESKPNGFVDNLEIDRLKELFISVIEQFEIDYNKNMFIGYTQWTNRTGIEITNIDDAIAYVLFHEGIHLGYVMALKRLVKK
jgi:hypothetical protein